MRHAIDRLRYDATMLNNQYCGLSLSSLLRDIESQLRSLLSYQTIESQYVPLLKDTLVLVKSEVEKSMASFLEKQQILTLIRDVQKRLEIKLLNPYNCKISNYTREKLLSLSQYGYIGNVTITSAGRSVEDQARIMYENILKHGKQHQLETYLQPGKNVINAYDERLSREENIAKMADVIRKEGPGRVSKHVGDFDKINVIDIDKKSLSNIQAFKDAVRKAGFTKVLDENNCIHIELPQPQ
jgi:hypothetical protein